MTCLLMVSSANAPRTPQAQMVSEVRFCILKEQTYLSGYEPIVNAISSQENAV